MYPVSRSQERMIPRFTATDKKILGDIAEIYSGTFDTTEKNGEYTCTLVMQMKERQTENI